MNDKTISKFLSLVLRHQPETIGLTLDAHGWTSVDDLLKRMAAHGKFLTREKLERVVAENDKKRYTLSDDGLRIRAAQGHSVEVDLALLPGMPPDILYHGTATRFVAAIQNEGLKPQSRQQVHLSLDYSTATKVGQRHGKPYIFRVEAGRMQTDGHLFFRADNGVWLTDAVPPQYLIAPDSAA